MTGSERVSVHGDFLHRLNTFAGTTADDHLSVSRVHSKGVLDLLHQGLGGTALPAGLNLGDHRDSDFSSRVYKGVQRLGEVGGLALRSYTNGDDAAHAQIQSHGFGTDKVINPV
ncbi:hypothetical protein AB0J72_16475 [Dactylosporangium sp. NPDC049742]|uniref:hypothetical protein n=1 Tax=Dactylosporangium sp. NPDC049742 TaxID=3154737 RepID=UPI00341BB62E